MRACSATRQRNGHGGRGVCTAAADRDGSRIVSHAHICVRLESGFASPAVFDFLEGKPKVEYVVAMASNAVLNRKAEEAIETARLMSGLTGETEHVYDETRYAAGSWTRERRVIIKAEVV